MRSARGRSSSGGRCETEGGCDGRRPRPSRRRQRPPRACQSDGRVPVAALACLRCHGSQGRLTFQRWVTALGPTRRGIHGTTARRWGPLVRPPCHPPARHRPFGGNDLRQDHEALQRTADCRCPGHRCRSIALERSQASDQGPRRPARARSRRERRPAHRLPPPKRRSPRPLCSALDADSLARPYSRDDLGGPGASALDERIAGHPRVRPTLGPQPRYLPRPTNWRRSLAAEAPPLECGREGPQRLAPRRQPGTSGRSVNEAEAHPARQLTVEYPTRPSRSLRAASSRCTRYSTWARVSASANRRNTVGSGSGQSA